MSDMMLIGVLRMPPECWNDDSGFDKAQRHNRYVEAADRIESEPERIEAAVREAVEAERERHPRMKRIPADHIEWNEWDGYFLNNMVTRPDWAHREAWLLSDMEGYWIEQPTGDDDE